MKFKLKIFIANNIANNIAELGKYINNQKVLIKKHHSEIR
jgi:hypothetical protein